MKKYFLFLLFILVFNHLSAQDEIELVSISFGNIGPTSIKNESYPILNKVKLETSNINLSLNYGHPIGDNGFEMIYSFSYEYVSSQIDKSLLVEDENFLKIPEYYYYSPNFSNIEAIIGLEKEIFKNMKLNMALTMNLSDDIFKNDLYPKFQFGNLTYIEKIVNKHFSYGLGIYLNQLKGKLFTYPLLSLEYKNTKRGVALLFPSYLKLHQMITKKSYLEIELQFLANSLKYKLYTPTVFVNSYSLNSGLYYNYIWQKHFKLNMGINLPLRFFDVNDSIKKYNYSLENNLALRIGVSFIIE